MLRSCYKTRVAFSGDPNESAEIQWYFCDPAAEPLPFPTPFVSRNYVDAGEWPDLGEVEGATRPWRNGSFPIPVVGTGEPCGSRSVWEEGWLPRGAMPDGLNRNDYGVAYCCSGQVDVNGQPLFEFLPGVLEQGVAKHYFAAAVAVRGEVLHSLSSVFGQRMDVSHTFGGLIANVGNAVHTFHAELSQGYTVTHTITSVVQALVTESHTLDALVASAAIVIHNFAGVVGTSGAMSHSFSATICPTPGALVIPGYATGSWTVPPGIFFANVWAWGGGGKGDAYFPPYGGSAGGGGGFAQAINRPVIPGNVCGYTVDPDNSIARTVITIPPAAIQGLRGSPGTTLGGGSGGGSSGGDINLSGGDGGDAGSIVATAYGAGGGGSAGPLGAGNAGQDASISTPGQGGAAICGWGEGGQGGVPLGTTYAEDGEFPGGGGGGQAYGPEPQDLHVNGGFGLLIVTWNAAVHFVHSVLYHRGTGTHTFTGLPVVLFVLWADDSSTVLFSDDGVTVLEPG